jgi:hypothetical protein
VNCCSFSHFFDSNVTVTPFCVVGFLVPTCLFLPWETGRKELHETNKSLRFDKAVSAQVPKSNGRTGSI